MKAENKSIETTEAAAKAGLYSTDLGLTAKFDTPPTFADAALAEAVQINLNVNYGQTMEARQYPKRIDKAIQPIKITRDIFNALDDYDLNPSDIVAFGLLFDLAKSDFINTEVKAAATGRKSWIYTATGWLPTNNVSANFATLYSRYAEVARQLEVLLRRLATEGRISEANLCTSVTQSAISEASGFSIATVKRSFAKLKAKRLIKAAGGNITITSNDLIPLFVLWRQYFLLLPEISLQGNWLLNTYQQLQNKQGKGYFIDYTIDTYLGMGISKKRLEAAKAELQRGKYIAVKVKTVTDANGQISKQRFVMLTAKGGRKLAFYDGK